jgi:hypothetical protein
MTSSVESVLASVTQHLEMYQPKPTTSIFSRKPWVFMLFLLLLTTNSCVPGGDGVDELSGGYFFRDEGGKIKDILCVDANGGEIPATVTGYGANEFFIVASQVPKLPPDPLYGRFYGYSNGGSATYYWIIDLKGDSVWGPLSREDYQKGRSILRIPDDLVIEELY